MEGVNGRPVVHALFGTPYCQVAIFSHLLSFAAL